MKVYFEHIYEHIGYLFYAVAAKEGKLNAVAFDKLDRLISGQWSAGNGTSLDSYLVSYLRAGLRNAFDMAMTAEEAFDHFKNYYDLHSLPFGKALRFRIASTANMIASEFSGKEKSPDLISGLEKILEVVPVALA